MCAQAYANWQYSRAHLAMTADWFEVNSLMDALQDVKRKHLKCTKDDLIAINKLIFSNSDRSKNTLYSEKVRFPENKKYVCDALGDWKQKLTHLRALCQSASLNSAPSEAEAEQITKLVFEMIDDLFWSAAVLDRTEFELWGSVRWGSK